jgi:hypothetical protein
VYFKEEAAKPNEIGLSQYQLFALTLMRMRTGWQVRRPTDPLAACVRARAARSVCALARATRTLLLRTRAYVRVCASPHVRVHPPRAARRRAPPNAHTRRAPTRALTVGMHADPRIRCSSSRLSLVPIGGGSARSRL